MDEKIRLGISTCLLGEKVRYDGGHKLDHFLVDTVGQFVEFVPVCPEAECGLGIPRESMHLEGNPDAPRLVTSHTHQDITARMQQWCLKKLDELEGKDLCGFIFKSNSPSSGMYRVKVFQEDGHTVKTGSGIFAGMFKDRFPLLPVEDEGRLHDPDIRENFFERVFAYKRWRELLASKWSLGSLIRFHTAHKLMVFAHSPDIYRHLGALLAEGSAADITELYRDYELLFMRALSLKATRQKQVNVLMHILGYFKTQLKSDEKKEALDLIHEYREGYVPLIVPITLLSHFVRKYEEPYLKKQYYLHPHPIELMLRNHV
ncbi:MAG TPA: DUF523 and DUF1722 domain-containing protein [Nitrospirota bacterium]|jgi:uncharacterized protein YbgA (DUF1722 family)/uncharacterized protein YbbK (DUF523 family)